MSEDIEDNVVKKEAVKRVAQRKTKAGEAILEATHNTSDDPIANIQSEGVMVKMQMGHSYYSPTVEFTQESPFQLVDPTEAEYLLSSYAGRFVIATKRMVEEFYQLG
jgi:hypothetical protein